MSTRRPTVIALLLVILLVTAPVALTAASTAETVIRATIAAVYPNPATEDDAGEYVVLAFPEATNVSGWTITDGKTTARLPNTTTSGRVAVSTDAPATRNITDLPVLTPSGRLLLANGGETLELRESGATIDTVTYASAPSAELFRPEAANDPWIPLGRTNRSVTWRGPTTVQAFVLPDAPEVPAAVLESGERRILLAGYTFSSKRAARHLRRAARRNVTVRVLVEDAPVGGISQRQATVLDSLVESGIDVQVIGGPRARYSYQHGKYAVVDDRALVMTENWKPSGVGGHGNRGWGVVVGDRRVADDLASVFEADIDWRDTVSWETFRKGRNFESSDPATATYPSRFAAKELTAESVSVVVAPDNAERTTVDLLDSAQESIAVEQVAIGDRRQPFIRAALDAARRGVTVRILLSSAWYVREDNQRLVDWLNERADEESISLRARLVEPRSRFEKVHAKGVIVDEETVVVGSMNWNNHSARENREVMVVLKGEKVGGFYASVFDADWKGGSSSGGVPVGLLIAVGVGLLAAKLVASRRVQFE